MLPGLNFNPNFANLAALHGLTGGMPHPIGMPVGARPITYGGQPPMPGPMPVYSGLPGQRTAPMQAPAQNFGGMPQGNLGNLDALMQLFGRR